MFTNFRRKTTMSRGGHNGFKRWPADGKQYRGFNERDRFERDNMFHKQQPSRFQSGYHPQDRRYNTDQNARYAQFQHVQHRQHPPSQAWNYDSSYDSRQKSYHDNKENKNNPNYQRYTPPRKEDNHDRLRDKRKRSHSPQRRRRGSRSRSSESTHSRKKRRIKEKRRHSKSPANKSDFLNKGNSFQRENRRQNEDQPDERYYNRDHRNSRTPVVTKFHRNSRAPVPWTKYHKKKKFFPSYFINKNRYTWRKPTGKKHENSNGVSLGKKLTIPPISNDEFSQRREEAESEGDNEEGCLTDDLEEGEIDTGNDSLNERARRTKKQKRRQSEESKIKQERESKGNYTDVKDVVASNTCLEELKQERLKKFPVEDLKAEKNERHSYVQDTCKFFNRVTSDKTLSTGDNKDVDCLKKETNLVRFENNTRKENDSNLPETNPEKNNTLNLSNEKTNDLKGTTNAKTDTEVYEDVTVPCKIKSIKQGKRESVDKLGETLRLTKSSFICENNMIQKIVSLASKSLVDNNSDIESEMDGKDSKNVILPKNKGQVTDVSKEVMESGEGECDKMSSVEVCKDMTKPNAMKSSETIEIPKRTGKDNTNFEQNKINRHINEVQVNDYLDIKNDESPNSSHNVHDDNPSEKVENKVNVKGGTLEKVILTNKNETFVKDQNYIEPKTFSSSCGNQNLFPIKTNGSELKRKKTGQEKSEPESRDNAVVERPITPPPYTSQSSKQNKRYYFENGPSFARFGEHQNQPDQSDAIGTQYKTKNYAESNNLRHSVTISSSEDDKETFSSSSRNLDNAKKNEKLAFKQSTSVNNKNGCPTVNKSGCHDRQKLSLKNKSKHTTYIESSKNNSRKRHGGVHSATAILSGRKNQPSDGVFYPLGKHIEDKHKVIKTVPAEQQTECPKIQNEQNPKEGNVEVICAQEGDSVHRRNSKVEDSEKEESVPRVKESLFNKNKRRISHFNSNSIESNAKKPKVFPSDTKAKSSIYNGPACKSPIGNIFEKMEDKFLVSSNDKTGTNRTLDRKISLVSDRDAKKKMSKENVEKCFKLKTKGGLNVQEIEKSKLFFVKENAMETAETKSVNGKKNIAIETNETNNNILNTVTEIKMLSKDNNRTCLNVKEDDNDKKIDKKNDEMNLSNPSENTVEMKTVQCTVEENSTEHNDKENQNASGIKQNHKGLQNHSQNWNKEPDIWINDTLIGREDSDTCETRKNYHDESEGIQKEQRKPLGENEKHPKCTANGLFLNEKAVENVSESEDDMDDIEPIEMIGSVFMNDFNIDDGDTENSLTSKRSIEINENDLKVDYCDDSIVFRRTNSDGESEIIGNIDEGKENETKNESEGYSQVSHLNSPTSKESLSKSDSKGDMLSFSNTDIEKNDETGKEAGSNRSPTRCFRKTERKRFSAQLETIGKKFDEEKADENKETQLKINSNSLKEIISDNEKTQNETEKIHCTKSTEWLKLAKTNMQNLVKGKPKTQKQTDTSTQDENDTYEEDLPSAKRILQWDAQQPIMESVKRSQFYLSATITTSSQSLSTSSQSDSGRTLKASKSKVIYKSPDGTSNHESQLTANCTIKGIHMSISSSNCAEETYETSASVHNQAVQNLETLTSLSSNLDTHQSVTRKASNINSKQNDVIAQNHSVMRSQTGQFSQHNLKETTNERAQKPNMPDKHLDINITAKEVVSNNPLIDQPCFENGYRDISAPSSQSKNGAALSPIIANVPMYSQLTAPLMDRNTRVEINQAPFNLMCQTNPDATNNNFMTKPPVMSSNLPITNHNAVTPENFTLAYAQVEMPGVREPVGPNTSPQTTKPVSRPDAKHPGTDVQDLQTQLLREVSKEERRCQLYRELCDLDNINTGDFGLDLLLLSKKSELRGLAYVNKEYLRMRTERYANNFQQQQNQQQQQSFQSSSGHRNTEERIHYLGNLKRSQK
ncbi:uncharacterized protein MAL13P1.304-like isoform X2 [Ruditapes philippinarum]|uniref:uncharacterized protein MAL13P1.304-like isoform X2 n=1 Tax=Ruditapes philippinarum TaxID=129788 RepID=UPI00295BB479|nr:uncharacterized protein MAL13P1.304-like isoform X2 [Ruditapes philippinarum]